MLKSRSSGFIVRRPLLETEVEDCGGPEGNPPCWSVMFGELAECPDVIGVGGDSGGCGGGGGGSGRGRGGHGDASGGGNCLGLLN